MEARYHAATLERDHIDMETGTFSMTLATDGEASDGDILSIEGASFPERVPLQNAHMNEARSTLGSVTGFRRDMRGSPKRLRARGQIEMDGESESAAIRRDVAFMVSQGHITGVSVRWEPIEWVARTQLAKDHPAFVDGERESDPRKRWGLYFSKWRVLEGSIAPVQADRESMIGRAGETDGEVSAFWRTMADQCDKKRPDEIILDDPTCYSERDRDKYMRTCVRAGIPEQEASEAWDKATPSNEARLAAFAAQVRELVTDGIDINDLDAAVRAEMPDDAREAREADPAEAGTSGVEVTEPDGVPERETVIESVEPAAPVPRRIAWNPAEVAAYFEQSIARRDAVIKQELQALVDKARGKV